MMKKKEQSDNFNLSENKKNFFQKDNRRKSSLFSDKKTSTNFFSSKPNSLDKKDLPKKKFFSRSRPNFFASKNEARGGKSLSLKPEIFQRSEPNDSDQRATLNRPTRRTDQFGSARSPRSSFVQPSGYLAKENKFNSPVKPALNSVDKKAGFSRKEIGFSKTKINTPSRFVIPKGNLVDNYKTTSVTRRFSRPNNKQKFSEKNYFNNDQSNNEFSTVDKVKIGKSKIVKNKLRVMVMGGCEEVGRNMTIFEYENDIFIIDMGFQFPEEDMPGIDYIIPNVSYLEDKKDRIRGVILTHGHLDHIGGIPYLMQKIGNPVIYTGALTAGLVKRRQLEYRDSPELRIQVIKEGSKIKFGSAFSIGFLAINHNIPDSFWVIIDTPVGRIVHTGDYKFDEHPIHGSPIDFRAIEKLGNEGVLAVLADSTNAEKPGHQISETAVKEEIDKLFGGLSGRVIIGTFSTNLSRIQSLISLAEIHHRKVVLLGRSINQMAEVAHELGYLKYTSGTLVEWKEAHSLPDHNLMIICTGAQGEKNAVLMRAASNEDKNLHLKKGDVIVFSSSVVPGNERTVQTLKDALYRKKTKVIHYEMMDIHAGGHAKQGDILKMYQLLKPKYYIPIESNHSILCVHAELIQNAGHPEKRIFIPDNGQVIEFGARTAGLTTEKVNTDYVFVDGLGVGDVSEIVLRDRRMMATDGMIVIIVTIAQKTGQLIQNPDLISRGFIYMKENKDLVEETRRRVRKICEDHDPNSPAFEDYVKNKIRNGIGEFLFKRTKRRPMVLPVLIAV